MKDIIDDNPQIPISDLAEGMQFLIDRELLALASEEGDVRLYGVTDEGVKALYMLSLVMASGVTVDEIRGLDSPPEVNQVSQRARALVSALDELTDGIAQ